MKSLPLNNAASGQSRERPSPADASSAPTSPGFRFLADAVRERSAPAATPCVTSVCSPPVGSNSRLLSGEDFGTPKPAFAELPKLRPGSRSARNRRKGAVKRAQILDRVAFTRADQFIESNSRSLESDSLKLRLSRFTGLRAGEISDLPIDAMVDSRGRIRDVIVVYASKTRTKREIPMHVEVRVALRRLLDRYPDATHVAFSIGRNGRLRHQSASCVANWFFRLYRSAGLIGASSHSGRRTFATDISRLLPADQSSLKDLQLLMGHARLSSTECYLEPSGHLDRLIQRLGA